jgi:hypothetical protein
MKGGTKLSHQVCPDNLEVRFWVALHRTCEWHEGRALGQVKGVWCSTNVIRSATIWPSDWKRYRLLDVCWRLRLSSLITKAGESEPTTHFPCLNFNHGGKSRIIPGWWCPTTLCHSCTLLFSPFSMDSWSLFSLISTSRCVNDTQQ